MWGTSVAGQIVSQFFRFDWVAPTGLNEIATAVVMWILARNHQATKAEQEPPAAPPTNADSEAEADD
ncbi:hypothetical protein INP59_03595 [Rhodococcus pyridinivorans]|uniref:Uncharacterized protein n=1 Tax=Rhodococcus pyridinivorans TaxID=103816 RepID=A0A7M2XP44_9NOCA|nr:hypothetical protein INP59_03595 [Rhodococcus pyridinivorans]